MRFSRTTLLIGLQAFLLFVALSGSNAATADIPALCEPAKRRFDEAIAGGNRGNAISARQRIRALSKACPQLWDNVRQRKLPSDEPKTPDKSGPPKQKSSPNSASQRSSVPDVDPLIAQLQQAQKAGDWSRAESIMSGVCHLSAAARCIKLSKELAIYGDGTGPFPTPQAKAIGQKYWSQGRELLAQECLSGTAKSCTAGSNEFFHNVGKESDLNRSRMLLEKGCSMRDDDSCFTLAHYLERGWGGPADYVRARSLWSQGCSAGRGNHCGRLAEMHELGKGGAVDLQQARSLFAKACKLGDSWGCRQRKRLQ